MSVQTPARRAQISFWTKLVFGSGDWSISSFGTLRQIFYAIFLTDVVGLEARLASVVALVGVVWDAINDPLVGMLATGCGRGGGAAARSCCSSRSPSDSALPFCGGRRRGRASSPWPSPLPSSSC